MFTTLKKMIATGFSLLLIVFTFLLIGVPLYFVLSFILTQAQVEVSGNFLLVVVTAITSFGGFILNNNEIKKREIAARHFEKKLTAYESFVNLLSDCIVENIKEETMPEKEQKKFDKKLEKATQRFQKGIIVWGNATTIEAWNHYMYRAEKNTEKSDPLHLFDPMDKLLLAIRKDLGHDDGTMDKYALIKMYLNAEGIKELDEAIRHNK